MMHAGVIFYRFRKDSIKEAIADWKGFVLPEVNKQPGFVKAELFVNEDTGEGFDIGYWSSEEAAEHFEESGLYEYLMNDFSSFLEGPPRRERFVKVDL